MAGAGKPELGADDVAHVFRFDPGLAEMHSVGVQQHGEIEPVVDRKRLPGRARQSHELAPERQTFGK
jgi:hypothetical protein